MRVCVCEQAPAAQELDERCFLSAQSMPSLKVSEHFQVVKLLGEGSYGKVMLAVHRKRGERRTHSERSCWSETVTSQFVCSDFLLLIYLINSSCLIFNG